MDDLSFYNVVYAFPNGEDFAISDVLRQQKDAKINRILICLSFHPQMTPAKDLIPILCKRFARIRDGVAGSGIEVAVLVQSTQGHGWNGKVPLTMETWQHTVSVDGKEDPRMCFADPGFREYALECIRSIAKEGPTLILLDDDFGLRRGECFCPLHMAEINEKMGTSYTREELFEILNTRHWSDEVAIKTEEILLESTLQYCREVREVINSVNPKIRCGICSCYGLGYAHNDAVAHTLAGDTEPFVRVNNDTYGDVHTHSCFSCFLGGSRVKYLLNNISDVVDEADTFPHNYMSESAAMFHTHLTTALLSGMSGAKLWTFEDDGTKYTGSQARYEKKLHDYNGFYREIKSFASRIKWRGLSGLAFKAAPGLCGHPIHSHKVIYNGNWKTPLEGMYALPLRYEALDSGGISTLRDWDADNMTDDQLRTLLSHDVVISSLSARMLSKRGFSSLMGVEADAGDSEFFFSAEQTADGELSSGYMWDESTARIKPLSDRVEVLSWFCKGGVKAFPAATLYTNELGGRILVLGWRLDLNYTKMFRTVRRDIFLKYIDAINGSTFEMAIENGDKTLVRHGVLDSGEEILAIVPLGFDVHKKLPIRLVRTPKTVEVLNPDGSWSKVNFARVNEKIVEVEVFVACLHPVVLRFAF